MKRAKSAWTADELRRQTRARAELHKGDPTAVIAVLRRGFVMVRPALQEALADYLERKPPRGGRPRTDDAVRFYAAAFREALRGGAFRSRSKALVAKRSLKLTPEESQALQDGKLTVGQATAITARHFNLSIRSVEAFSAELRRADCRLELREIPPREPEKI